MTNIPLINCKIEDVFSKYIEKQKENDKEKAETLKELLSFLNLCLPSKNLQCPSSNV